MPDLDPVAALLGQIFGVEPQPVADDGPETVADFPIGDLTLRVVEQRSASGRGTLHSVTLRVDLRRHLPDWRLPESRSRARTAAR